MPLFDFYCRQCDKHFELLVRSSPPVCPHCQSSDLEKQLSTPAAPAKSPGLIASARAQANKEGHFSHFSASERKKILKNSP